MASSSTDSSNRDSVDMDSNLWIFQSDYDNADDLSITLPDAADYYFWFKLSHQHEHQPGMFSVTIEDDLIIPRRKYFEEATSITRNMVTTLNVDPTHVESYVSEIRSSAAAMGENPSCANTRILSLTVIIITCPRTFNILEDHEHDHDQGQGQVTRFGLEIRGTLAMLHETVRLLDQLIEFLDSSESLPATKSSIEALKEVKVDDFGTEATIEQCTICLEKLSFELNENHDDHHHHEGVVSMPCSHVFHMDCIVQWLEINHKCPLCRYAMPT